MTVQIACLHPERVILAHDMLISRDKPQFRRDFVPKSFAVVGDRHQYLVALVGYAGNDELVDAPWSKLPISIMNLMSAIPNSAWCTDSSESVARRIASWIAETWTAAKQALVAGFELTILQIGFEDDSDTGVRKPFLRAITTSRQDIMDRPAHSEEIVDDVRLLTVRLDAVSKRCFSFGSGQAWARKGPCRLVLEPLHLGDFDRVKRILVDQIRVNPVSSVGKHTFITEWPVFGPVTGGYVDEMVPGGFVQLAPSIVGQGTIVRTPIRVSMGGTESPDDIEAALHARGIDFTAAGRQLGPDHEVAALLARAGEEVPATHPTSFRPEQLVLALEQLTASLERSNRRRLILAARSLLRGEERGVASFLDQYVPRTTNGSDLWSCWELARATFGAANRRSDQKRTFGHLATPDAARTWLAASLRRVPSGEFSFGAVHWDRWRHDEPRQETRAVKEFWMSSTLVPVEVYQHFDPGFSLPDRVMEGVEPGRCGAHRLTWHEVLAFCAWTGVRAPREDEWEYAIRAGSQHVFIDDDAGAELPATAWGAWNANGLPAVGTLRPNAWGIHDGAGLLWEYCVADETRFGRHGLVWRGGGSSGDTQPRDFRVGSRLAGGEESPCSPVGIRLVSDKAPDQIR